MKTLKSKQTRSQITVLSNNDLMEKPSAYPAFPVLGKMAKSMGIDMVSKKFETGIVLNAHHPEEIGKMKLIVPIGKYTTVKNYDPPPYYYKFDQWALFFDMVDGELGKVTIRFDRGYLIQDGIIFLRVGGILNSMMGHGYNIFDGKSNINVSSKHGLNDEGIFISQTIPVHIQKSSRTKSLLDITITSSLISWKFFDAKYSPFSIAR